MDLLRPIALLALVALLASCSGEVEPQQVESLDGEPAPVIDSAITRNGVVIRKLKDGDGQLALPDSTVTVHFHGTLDDGTVFETTRGKPPVTFSIPTTIEGWQEGVPGMRVGEVRQLLVPPELAYGRTGEGRIPPNATLTFTIELLDVE